MVISSRWWSTTDLFCCCPLRMAELIPNLTCAHIFLRWAVLKQKAIRLNDNLPIKRCKMQRRLYNSWIICLKANKHNSLSICFNHHLWEELNLNFLGGSTFPRVFLGGGFKYFVCSPLFGEDFQFDFYFSDGLKPPARRASSWGTEPMRGFVPAAFVLLARPRLNRSVSWPLYFSCDVHKVFGGCPQLKQKMLNWPPWRCDMDFQSYIPPQKKRNTMATSEWGLEGCFPFKCVLFSGFQEGLVGKLWGCRDTPNDGVKWCKLSLKANVHRIHVWYNYP